MKQMDKLELKKRIVEACKKKQQSIINDFETSIKRQRESAQIRDERGLQDRFESKYDEDSMQISLLADQLNFANQEMETLNKIVIAEPHNEVTFGSVVVAGKKIFFVSTSAEAFQVDGQEVFALSTKAPLYQDMKGKKKGDKFSSYEITDLF